MAALGSKQTRAHSYGVSIQEHFEIGHFIGLFLEHLANSQKKSKKRPNLEVEMVRKLNIFDDFCINCAVQYCTNEYRSKYGH